MNQPSRYTAFLDASILFSVFKSNFILFLSQSELFRVRWSPDVHEEWIRAQMERRQSVSREALERKRSIMDSQFPDALVTGYEILIDNYKLDDLDDRHVVAAAEKGHANVIVTDNPKDFPADKIPKSIIVQTADQFVADQFDVTISSARQVATAMIRHQNSLTKSRPNWKTYCENFAARFPLSNELATTQDFESTVETVLLSGEWKF